MEAFDERRCCRSQRHPVVYARRDEHRDLHFHAVLSVPEVRERQDQPRIVSGDTDCDGCRDLLARVRDFALLLVFALLPVFACGKDE